MNRCFRSARIRAGVGAVALAACSGCGATSEFFGEGPRAAATEAAPMELAVDPHLFRTADGNLVLELSRDQFTLDRVSGSLQLGADARRALVPLGRRGGERFIALERGMTFSQYLDSIDAWVDQEVRGYGEEDVFVVPGEEIERRLRAGAKNRYGLELSDDAGRGLPDLPGGRLKAIPAPYRLLIGVWVTTAGATLIAFSIAATATGAVVVAPPLLVAGASVSGLGATLILSVVYSEGQEALFQNDIQEFKTALRNAAMADPSAAGALRPVFFDPNGFGYAAGTVLPERVSRVFPLDDDALLVEADGGTLYELRYGDLRVRRVRSAPARARWVAPRGDEIVIGCGVRDVVVIDRATHAERRRWQVPAEFSHDRVRFRYLARVGMVMQDESGDVAVEPLNGAPPRPAPELRGRLHWMTEEGDRLIARVGERDFLAWEPGPARVERIRSLEGFERAPREHEASAADDGASWSWFVRPDRAAGTR